MSLTPALVTADESNSGWMASVTNDRFVLRKLVSERGAAFVGVRASFYDSSYDSGSWMKTTDVLLEAGYRRYLGSSEVKHSIDSSMFYVHPKTSSNYIVSDDPVIVGVELMYGVEKSLSQRFSVEGAAGIRVDRMETSMSKHTGLVVPVTRVGISYHF